MKPNPYAGRSLWSFDTETWLIQPGLLAPSLVCGSWAVDEVGFGTMSAGIMNKAHTLAAFRRELLGSDVIAGQNIAYDMGVMCAADPTLIPLVFAKYDRDEVFDTMIAEQLIQIHEGTLGQGHSSSGSGFSLAELGMKYLGVDMSEDKTSPDAWRLRYAELDGVPLEQWPEAAKAYPIRDARYTYDVAVKQIADGRNLHDLPAQCRAAWALHLSAIWGIRTAKKWVDDFTVKVTAEHSRTRAKFLAAGLLKVNRCTKDQQPDEIDMEALRTAGVMSAAVDKDSPRSFGLARALQDVATGRAMRYGTDKKALEGAVIEAYKGEPPRSSKGNVRCNKDTLWESGDQLLEAFADAQETEKYFSTYLKILAQGTTVPINPRINILVDTGRCSYSKPNLQNQPRGGTIGNPREGYVARPGTVMWSCDYPTLELRTLAAVLEYLGFKSEMAKALRAINPNGSVGMDLHAKLGAQIKGCSYEEFMSALERKEKWAKDFRQMSKAANFGLPGGLGPAKLVAYARQSYDARFCILAGLATECGIEKVLDKRSKTTVCKTCLGVAQELKKTWFAAWPEMNDKTGYFALVKEWTARETRTVRDDEGFLEEISVGSVTQIITERVRGGCTFTNGANTTFQGLASDISKRGAYLMQREAYTDPTSPLWDSRLLIFIHDELFGESPIAKAAAAAERACRLMEQAFKEFCPSIPCDVEPALAYRWYKDAFTARDSSGRVVPVEKCPECKTLAPLGWDNVWLEHKTKGDPCKGAGRQLNKGLAD